MDGMIYVRIGALLVLIAWAAWTDVKSRRIPNKLTLPFAIAGFILHALEDFPAGLVTALVGFAVGFGVFLIPYLMKAMGAGDVKLMAAIGALTDGRTVLAIVLFTALSGGILVIGKKAVSGGGIRTLKRTGRLLAFYFFSLLALLFPVPTMKERKERFRVDISDKQNDFMPYALAIAAGTVITLILSRTGVLQGLSI